MLILKIRRLDPSRLDNVIVCLQCYREMKGNIEIV